MVVWTTVFALEEREVAGFWMCSIPRVSKVCLTPLCSKERPTSLAVFTNRKKPKEDFCFYFLKRSKNVKIAFSICFAASC